MSLTSRLLKSAASATKQKYTTALLHIADRLSKLHLAGEQEELAHSAWKLGVQAGKEAANSDHARSHMVPDDDASLEAAYLEHNKKQPECAYPDKFKEGWLDGYGSVMEAISHRTAPGPQPTTAAADNSVLVYIKELEKCLMALGREACVGTSNPALAFSRFKSKLDRLEMSRDDIVNQMKRGVKAKDLAFYMVEDNELDDQLDPNWDE